MRIDKFGQVIVNDVDLFDSLYKGNTIPTDILVEEQPEIDQYNNSINLNADHIEKLRKYVLEDISVEFFDEANQVDWFIPEDKVHHNLVEMLYGMCKTEEETNRVSAELELFIQHGMLDVLFYLKYLVDTMREHNIVWGVGRGSSVASYVLFLLGVHKVNSIKYQLDIHEFLK